MCNLYAELSRLAANTQHFFNAQKSYNPTPAIQTMEKPYMKKTLVVETDLFKNTPKNAARYSVIWLHGLGADGYDFAPMATALEKTLPLPVRFIFPHAPLRAVTLNNGYVMPAWYDITGLDLHAREDKAGLTETTQTVDALIQHENQQDIPTENILLGGFSQGGASAVYIGTHYPQKLRGIIVFSGYLPFYKTLQQDKHPANQETSIFWAQGLNDTVVIPSFGKIAVRALKSAEYNVAFKHYEMGHEVCDEEIQDCAQWILSQCENIKIIP